MHTHASHNIIHTPHNTGEAALIAAVLNSNAAQSGDLVVSLMRAYCAADYVVGLDVDKDSFDKYNMRAHIGERATSDKQQRRNKRQGRNRQQKCSKRQAGPQS